MGYNYSREKRKFDAEWKKKEAWCSGGDLSVLPCEPAYTEERQACLPHLLGCLLPVCLSF